jgi:hypothetical protein
MNSYLYRLCVMTGYILVSLVLFSGCRRTHSATEENRKANGSDQSTLVKPFRVLVIIGDQWKDPLSYHIDSRRVDGTDFIDVITMLIIWGIPFDVLRLDEQRLQINRFLDGEAKPKYGCMIWMADPDKLSGYSANFKTVKMAVENYGISMIALFDYIRTKPVADLPQLIARDIRHDTKVVWIGGGKDSFRKYPAMRKISRKALVHAIGYGIFNDNFENGYIFIMDDIGCSEHAYSLRWHYPTPARDTLVKYLIGPLEKHGLIMVQNITPGYANPLTNMIELREGTHGGDDNGRVAAIAGLGISRECYVGIDHTIEFSMMMPEQFTCHDLDLTAKTNSPADQTEAGWDKLAEMTTEQLVASKIAGGRRVNLRDSLNWIYAHKHQKWMGFNECCAYLHTQISNIKGGKPGLEFYYDDHYCKYFENKASRWTFETSDDFRNAVGSASWLFIDGKKVKKPMTDRQILEIPSGLGEHTVG